jgi:hypothetical protein
METTKVPGHHCVRIYLGKVWHKDSRWLHNGTVRRSTYTLGNWGLVILRKPRQKFPET